MEKKLTIVWTSENPEVAEKMVFMYAKNAKLRGWWDEIRLMVWGPSARLLAENTLLQEELHHVQAAGVEVVACEACTEMYGVTDQLRSMGINVYHIGITLTESMQSGWHTLTF